MMLKRFRWLGAALLMSLPARAQVDSRAEGYYLFCLGRMHELEGHAELALSHYQQAAEIDPSAAYPHLAQAELLASSHRADQAMESARRALDLDSELAGAHRLLGEIYFQLAQVRSDPELFSKAAQELKQTIFLEPSDVESRQKLAELHLLRGETSEATTELETILQYAPDSYPAMYRLGQVARERAEGAKQKGLLAQATENLRRAAELFQAALEVEPRHQASRLELGRVLTELGEFEQAASVYRDALEFTPQDSGLRVQLAYTLAYSGQLRPAAGEFERVLEAEEGNVEALLGLAGVRRGLKEPESSEALLRKVLEIRPQSVRARSALAGVYQDMREYRAAIRELETILSLPEGAYSKNLQAEYYAELGSIHQELGEHPAAIQAFEKARALEPSDARFEAALIQSLVAADETERAARLCGKARGRFSEDLRFQILDAQIQNAQGHEQKAVDALLELWKKAPTDEVLASAVVDLYQRQRRYAEAEKFLRTTLERFADSDRFLFLLGAILERQGNYGEAEKMFQKVLAVSPDNASALNYLGYMLADRGIRLEESLGYIQRAVALDPYNGAYLDSLGWVYYKLGDLDLAEANLLKSIKRLRLTGVVYDHLGDIYYRKGKRDEAIRSWEKALEEDDEDLEKEEVARKIERANAER